MKGLVFTEFIEMVETTFSPEMAERIIEASDLESGGVYTTLGTYDYDEIVQLVTHLSRETGMPASDLQFAFGKHLFGYFVVNHPWAIEGAETAFDFLGHVHDYIHVEVRKLYPDAQLPRFDYESPQPNQLIMHYQSARPFADLAHGLIVGCVEHYGETIHLERVVFLQESGSSVYFRLLREDGDSRAKAIPRPQATAPMPVKEETENGESDDVIKLKRKLQRERLARKRAEQLAEQKTREVFLANQEISALNDRLKEENLRLGAELEVTRQLQQMLLPKESELKQVAGLDIAGYMAPADEVGGDYYDVLQFNGRVLIAMGDVTGHGLESGVFMLMAQTAVRTLLTSNETDPARFLDVLNRTLYENGRRMGTDKNLTLILCEYENGRLTVSGQHEEIIIVRQNGDLEVVNTLDLGFPIGLEPSVADFVDQQTIVLQPDDAVILYTDGITEAEDKNGQHFGMERFCAIIKQHSAQTAEAIQQAIIDEVNAFIGTQKIYDDITLLVLKQT
jgi:serine phosphatase RsbU (regulator of sigma subunit)